MDIPHDAAAVPVRPGAAPAETGRRLGRPSPGESDEAAGPGLSAEAAVTALYQAHALRLIRAAHLILGDRHAAEDVVQEAFCGLYRRWGQLSDPGNGLTYLRSSVLNGCRSALRRRVARRTTPAAEPPPAQAPGLSAQASGLSAEAMVLSGEERSAVMVAVRRLPPRQREALVLRFYLELPDREIAAAMRIGPSTVRSATHRALVSLARMLKETS